MRADLARGADDIAHVGLALRRQRRRDADQDHVRLAQPRKIVRGAEAAPARGPRHPIRVEVLDVHAPLRERVDLGAVHIEPEHTVGLLRERQCERQAHVPEADDTHEGRPVLDLPSNLRSDRRGVELHLAHCVPGSLPLAVWRAPPPSVYAPQRVRTD